MVLEKAVVMADFAEKVANKLYKKLPYDTWRHLQNHTPSNWNIAIVSTLTASAENPIKVVIVWETCINPYEFSISDNSFGIINIFHQLKIIYISFFKI